MRKMKILACFFLFIICVSVPISNAICDEYSREIEFQPLFLTVEDIHTISNDLFNYVSNLNQQNNTTGYVFFDGEKYDLKLDLPLKENSIKQIPDRILEFSLDIFAYDDKISRVVLQFSDRRRFVQITGATSDQVVAFSGIINDKFSPHILKFRGARLRIMLAAIFWLFLSVIYFFLLKKFPDTSANIHAIISILVLIVIPNTVIFFVPWENIFPGFLITHSNLNFFEKNAPLFTFLSLLIGGFSPIVIWLINKFKVHKVKS